MQVLTKRTERFSETTIDDEIVVMNLDSGEFFSLVDTARVVWELIDGTRDSAGITALLADRYAVGHDSIDGQVEGFVAELVAAGLVGRG